MADFTKTLKRSINETILADGAVENAHMLLAEYDYNPGLNDIFTDAEKKRLKKALDALSRAREVLGDALYALDKLPMGLTEI